MFAPPGKMIGFGQLSIYPFRCQAKCTEHVPGRPCIPANSARYAIKMPPEWRGLKNMIAYLPKDKARSLQIGRNVDKHTQTKHLYAQLELYFTTLSGGSDTYTPIL